MKNHRSYPDLGPSSSQGPGKVFDAADEEGKSVRAADARKHEKKKDRSPLPISGCDGLDVAEAATTGTWTGEKKAKIQTAPTSENFGAIARDGGEQSDKIAHSMDQEQDWIKQIEGFDWEYDHLKTVTDVYVKQLVHKPPDDDALESLGSPNEQQRRELMSRLALYRIRALKGEELKDLDYKQLVRMYPQDTLEEQGYYEWCERDFEWFFDRDTFDYVGLEDYQRLVLRNDKGDYVDEDWESYCKLHSTLEGDQQYVQFWEKLSSEIKWIEKAMTASFDVWDKLERVAFYQAVKIAAGFPKIYSTLIHSGFTLYKWWVEHDITFYQGYAWLYFEIWKRIAKQKMDFEEALKQLTAEDMPGAASIHMDLELSTARRNLDRTTPVPGPVTYYYNTFVANINGELEECDAHRLIMDAVKKMTVKPMMYYDYAKEKLDIADKIGLIAYQTAQKYAYFFHQL